MRQYTFYCKVNDVDYDDAEVLQTRCHICALTNQEDHIPFVIIKNQKYDKSTSTTDNLTTVSNVNSKFDMDRVETTAIKALVNTSEKKTMPVTHPFAQGDKVRSKPKVTGKSPKYHGNVVHIICDKCDDCKAKKYFACTASYENKTRAVVSFPSENNQRKRSKLDFEELELEEPVPFKEEEIYETFHKSIRVIALKVIDIPIIEELESIKEESEEHENTYSSSGEETEDLDMSAVADMTPLQLMSVINKIDEKFNKCLNNTIDKYAYANANANAEETEDKEDRDIKDAAKVMAAREAKMLEEDEFVMVDPDDYLEEGVRIPI